MAALIVRKDAPQNARGVLAGLRADGILASVIRGLAGHIVAPARQQRTGATPAPQNPSQVCSCFAMPCARLLVGARGPLDGDRTWAPGEA